VVTEKRTPSKTTAFEGLKRRFDPRTRSTYENQPQFGEALCLYPPFYPPMEDFGHYLSEHEITPIRRFT